MKKAWWITGFVMNLRGCVFGKEKSDNCTDDNDDGGGDCDNVSRIAQAENFQTLPKKLPRTIEDVITVTQKLDFRYLWVDRYCINQQREKGKAHQIGKMDEIYMNAELTIIAAAGSNPNYGLPSVGH
jgi:hypothetical protein